MKKELTLFLAGLSLLAILTSAPFTTAVSPFVEVEVGDSFNYVVSKVYFYLEENNMVVAEETGAGIVNNTINVEVNEIFDSSNILFLGLPYETTVFNVTETIGEQSFQALTPLDMWYSMFVSLEFLYAMMVDGFNPYDPPGIIIEFPDTSTYDFMKGLPIFATSNTSFYEQLEADLNDVTSLNLALDDSNYQNPIINPEIPIRLTEVSYINGIFKLNVTNQGYFDEITTTEISWSVQGISNYFVEVDTNNGLVNEMFYGLNVKTIVDGYKTVVDMKVGIEKSDTGRTWTLGLTYLEPLLAVLGLTLVWVIVKKKKK